MIESTLQRELGEAMPVGLASRLDSIRGRYDEGLDRLLSEVPDELVQGAGVEAALNQLVILKKFRRDNVRWALGRLDSTVIVLEHGSTTGGWLAIGMQEPPAATDAPPAPVFRIDQVRDWHILHIRPVEISTEWAGIFLIHELSHLLYRINNPASVKSQTRSEWLRDELMAYRVEYQSVIHRTRDGYHRCLSDTLENLGHPSARELAEFRTSAVPYALLDRCVSSVPPRSEDELVLRRGFHHAALILKAAGLARSWNERVEVELSDYLDLQRALNIFLRNEAWDDDLDQVIYHGR